MTTRAQLKTRIRDELDDVAAVKLWSDGLFDRWIGDAIGDYSDRLPTPSSTTLATVAGQAELAIPADLVRVESVEWPEGVPVAPHSVGTDGPTWRLWPAGQLTLSPTPGTAGESVILRYWARWAAPAADVDVLATPVADDPILVDLVAWRALLWVSASEAKRQRFERSRGASASEEAGRYKARADAAMAARRSLARRQLWAPV